MAGGTQAALRIGGMGCGAGREGLCVCESEQEADGGSELERWHADRQRHMASLHISV